MENTYYLFFESEDVTRIVDYLSLLYSTDLKDVNTLTASNPFSKTNIQWFTKSQNVENKNTINYISFALSNKIAKIPADDKNDIKLNLIHRIICSNTFVKVEISVRDDYMSTLDADTYLYSIDSLVKKLALNDDHCVYTFADGSVFYNEFEEIIIDKTGKSDLDYYFPFEYKESKNEYRKLLFDQGIYCADIPPLVNEASPVKTHEEIARRAIGYLILGAFAEVMLDDEIPKNERYDKAYKFVFNLLDECKIDKLEEVLLEKELDYINNRNASEDDHLIYSMSYESLFLLEWVLCLAPMNIPTYAYHKNKEIVELFTYNYTVEDILAKTKVQPHEFLVELFNMYTLLTWTCTFSRTLGLNAPLNMNNEIIRARYEALCWLFNMP